MIHIYVDYQGPRADETDSYTDTGDAYQTKLDEIETYTGQIDRIMISAGSDKVGPGWDSHPREILVDTTNVGIGVRKGRKLKH